MSVPSPRAGNDNCSTLQCTYVMRYQLDSHRYWWYYRPTDTRLPHAVGI